jgi:glycosyltransferase involved in cell wall biosynthesis
MVRLRSPDGAVCVMHVVAPSAVGGLERVVQCLAVAQQRAGNGVHVVEIVDGDGIEPSDGFSAPFDGTGVHMHRVTTGPRGYRREREQVMELCRRIRPDVVHTHGYRPDVVDAAPARAAGVATVSTVHGFTDGSARNRCYEWLQRRALRHVGAVAAVARPIADRLLRSGVSADRVHVLQNAWTPGATPLTRAAARKMLAIPAEEYRIGWVGRVSHEKGLDVLIDALAEGDEPHSALSVIGTGPEVASSRMRAANAGVASRISWHGAIPAAARLFAAFDVLVMSSRTEGTPMVLLEAMAAGIPIVATSVGGVPDVVGADEALLVPSGDPEAIARALADVRANARAANGRALAARARLDREFNVERWLAGYRNLYASALDLQRAA